ncbi:MAG: hybrid sensor histidine kinase/response regulator [Gemmatimonadota bacterium]|nr:MAG: hybrid sensor histidine kinase/response regulator [Gemmatimonadota bacterium]
MKDTSEREKIVVIDDDYAMRLSCRQILSKSGFDVETFEDGVKGLEGIASLRPSLALVDLKMPGLSGMEVIPRIQEIDREIVIVVITGYATISTAVDAMKAGAYDFLPKPFKPDELRIIVNRGLERRRLKLASRQFELERELLKRRFVSFVSHQLKSPLAVIHQYLDVLRHLGETEDAQAKRRDWLDRCLERSEEMKALIDDWLTLAILESDSLFRERVKVDLKDIILRIIATYETMAAENGVTLQVDLPQDTYLVRGDLNCLGVLFDNLIVNAIKYNKRKGRVTVSASLENSEVVMSVQDTGVGIPEKYHEFLFDEFFRVKEAGSKVGGTGLGLPICKRIVSEMGGVIELQSQVDVGSTFRVRLPAFTEQRSRDDGTAS